MGYHLSPSNYDRSWTCSECSKPIDAIPGKFKIYNSRQLTCGKECAMARKVRLQAKRRAERHAEIFGGVARRYMPSAEISAVASRRELYRRTGKA